MSNSKIDYLKIVISQFIAGLLPECVIRQVLYILADRAISHKKATIPEHQVLEVDFFSLNILELCDQIKD